MNLSPFAQSGFCCLLSSNNTVTHLTSLPSGIALGYGLDDRGFESLQGLGIFLFTTASRLELGPNQPPIQLVQGAFTPRLKRPERAAVHFPPSKSEVKNVWSYTSAPQYVLWCGA